MSLPELLAKLRPLMTRAEIVALLGLAEANQALDLFSGYQRKHGVHVDFSFGDRVIDSIWFFSNFTRDVPVCGLRIGMDIDAVRAAMPEGRIDEPEPSGVTRFHARPASLDFAVEVAVRDGEVILIDLQRADLDEVRAARKKADADRKAERERKLERGKRWKSIKDPDEMLLSWAGSHSSDSGNRRRYLKFARWLIGSSDPNAWHIVGTRWNWDNGHAPLLWIIRQQNCDMATALEIFFLAQPSSYFRYVMDRALVPSHDLEMFDFVMEIRERFASGFYTRSQIAFDGAKTTDRISGVAASAEDEALADKFYPREAARLLPGRDLAGGDDTDLATCYAMLARVE